MIEDLFAEHIAAEFPHALTEQQHEAARLIGAFLSDPRSDRAFILRGYAGTGKTSLIAAVVRVWRKLQRTVVLLAPTGRAAKVFSHHAGLPATTIHKAIYRQQSFKGENTLFDRGWNGAKDALFIVDEASMIANQGGGSTQFGTGQLLDDLVQFVYAGAGCRLLFVGDTAQLPPVGESESPALQPRMMEGYGLHVRSFELTQVIRQAETSAVLTNATQLRQFIRHLAAKNSYFGAKVSDLLAEHSELPAEALNEKGLPLIKISSNTEVKLMPGDELIDALEQSYRNWGTDDTIIVTRTNKRANIFNNGVRSRILDREEILSRGDLVMAVRNNYYWTAQAQAELPEGEQLPIAFIANGDSAEIVRYHNVHTMHGLQFADVTLRFSDYDDTELECRVVLDTLQAEAPALTAEQQTQLYESVLADYAHIANQRERMKAIRQDPYYNALQIKYAYAVTCHKAQGGQWHEVFVDQGYLPEDLDALSYFRWLYTAFTRTSGNLYLVNWPKDQTYSENAE